MDVRRKRLIDAKFAQHIANVELSPDASGTVKWVLSHTPTVDAVEVVRCRDCKHRGTDYCIFHIKGEPADEELLRKLDNDFCSYGEREEGADNG